MARQQIEKRFFIILRQNFIRKMYPTVFNVPVLFDFHPFRLISVPVNKFDVEASVQFAKQPLEVCTM